MRVLHSPINIKLHMWLDMGMFRGQVLQSCITLLNGKLATIPAPLLALQHTGTVWAIY